MLLVYIFIFIMQDQTITNTRTTTNLNLNEVKTISLEDKYIIGNKFSGNHISPLSGDIKFSTFLPNITRDVIRELINIRQQNPNIKLYLLGVKYIEERDKNGFYTQGNDVQFGVSETSHYNETPINNANRGILEELQISLNIRLKLHKEFKNYSTSHSHFLGYISSKDQYKFPEKDTIIPDPSLDIKDTKNKKKASVYLYGEKKNLLPIVQNYEAFPHYQGSPHDPITDLVLIPFSDLERWLTI